MKVKSGIDFLECGMCSLARATCTANKSFLSPHNHAQGCMSTRASNL